MELILPSTFTINESNKIHNVDGKYDKYIGMPKLSYSQITSWLDPSYRHEYVRNYFIKTPRKGNDFTEFGSACGTFIESIGTDNPKAHDNYRHLLSQNDRDILSSISFKDNQVYEDYIVIDIDGKFVIEGFADRITYGKNTKHIIIEDFKTGSIEKNAKKYAIDDYAQTCLYGYAKELEGYKVKECKVLMFDRKGNGSEKHPIKLTGEIIEIDSKYSEEKVQRFLEKARDTAEDISENYKKFLKYFR